MNKCMRDHGYIVVCDGPEMYFEKAADAMRYAAFMASLGYDAVYYDAQIQDNGELRRFGRLAEQHMRACINLDL